MRLGILGFLMVSAVATLPTKAFSGDDLRKEIDARNKFLPLPLGKVRPEGWLKKEGELATAPRGLCGDMSILEDNVWRKPKKIKRRGATGWWPYEQQGYFMDGITRIALVMGDEKLMDAAKKTYDAVAERSSKNPNGYFFCDDGGYKKDWAEGKDEGNDRQRWFKTGVEGMYWSMAVFSRGLLAEYMATGDKRLLEVLKQEFRHYYNKGRDEKLRGKPVTGYELYLNRGMAMLGPMAEYIRLSGDEVAYGRAVEIFKNNEDGMLKNYLAGHPTTICHGVTYNELTKLYAIGYLLTGRKDYLQASVNAYDFVEKNHTQPHGVHTAQEFLKGIGSTKGTETCDVADYMWSNLWLLRATGKGKYADIIERAFYNAAQRAVSHDYRTHVYFQTPNQIPGHEVCGKQAKYIKCHRPICCARNLTRILPNFIGHGCMKTADGLAVIFYIPSKIAANVGGKDVAFHIDTNYPFLGDSKIVFDNADAAEFPLKLRVPGWCSNPAFKLNGKKLDIKADSDGFAVIARPWKKGDAVEVDFPMEPRVVEGVEQYIVDEKGKEAHMRGHGKPIDIQGFVKGAPFAYVARGPLTFSLPLKTEDDAKAALVVPQKNIKVSAAPAPDGWTWGDKPPVTLEVDLQKIDWPIGDPPKLPAKTFKLDPARVVRKTLIPYGCTDIHRMTMFPVAK